MDTKKKRRRWRNTSGLLSLEASIALTTFILLMLFMCSFFVVFEARNEVGHVLLTTADSLALDAFASEAVGEDTVQSVLAGLYGKVGDSDGSFTSNQKWYDGSEADLQNAIENRFIGYMGGGDRTEADKVLKELNIVGGIDGLDFSGSHITDDKLYLEVTYKLNYEFQVFGLGSIGFKQSCCSKLWK